MRNGRFQVTILGSGAALPTVQNRPTAQVVNVLENYFLIDCGEGTQVQMRHLGIKFQKINQIFISHLHGDHFFGLIGLISSYHLLGRTRELQIFGPKGLQEIIRVQLKHSKTYLNYAITFHEIDPGLKTCIFESNVCRIYSFPLKHRVDCTGFLIEERPGLRKLLPKKLEEHNVSIAYARKIKEGYDAPDDKGNLVSHKLLSSEPEKTRSYAFCSDTAYWPKIVEFINGVNCLYHESTFLESDIERAKKTQHSTALQAAKIAHEANVNKLLLGHFSARYADFDDFITEAQTVFKNVELALEGCVINVT